MGLCGTPAFERETPKSRQNRVQSGSASSPTLRTTETLGPVHRHQTTSLHGERGRGAPAKQRHRPPPSFTSRRRSQLHSSLSIQAAGAHRLGPGHFVTRAQCAGHRRALRVAHAMRRIVSRCQELEARPRAFTRSKSSPRATSSPLFACRFGSLRRDRAWLDCVSTSDSSAAASQHRQTSTCFLIAQTRGDGLQASPTPIDHSTRLGSSAPPLSHRLFIRLICGDPSVPGTISGDLLCQPGIGRLRLLSATSDHLTRPYPHSCR